MNYYELTCLISPAVSEEDRQKISGKLKEFIQKESGDLEKIALSAKKSLVYFVKKQEEAHLIVLNFYLKAEKIEELLKKLKAENQIIRYMLLNKKPVREELKKESLFRKAPDKSGDVIRKAKKEKVELKEIDKKIEEILQE